MTNDDKVTLANEILANPNTRVWASNYDHEIIEELCEMESLKIIVSEWLQFTQFKCKHPKEKLTPITHDGDFVTVNGVGLSQCECGADVPPIH